MPRCLTCPPSVRRSVKQKKFATKSLDGAGAVFLDDCGYDDSIGGYVMGIVVPI